MSVCFSYIYTDVLTLDSIEAALGLLYCADKYLLHVCVRAFCTQYIVEHLTPDKVCVVYDAAKMFNERELLRECTEVFY